MPCTSKTSTPFFMDSGSMTATEVLTLPAVEFELRVRATIAGMLFNPIQDDTARAMFVRILAELCHKQETRRPKAAKRKAGLVVYEANGPSCWMWEHRADRKEAEGCCIERATASEYIHSQMSKQVTNRVT